MLSAPEENHTSIVTNEYKCRRCLYRRCICCSNVSIPYLEIKYLFQNGRVLLTCRIFSPTTGDPDVSLLAAVLIF
jgi:hypothetical protein